jgi:hypothetical protein
MRELISKPVVFMGFWIAVGLIVGFQSVQIAKEKLNGPNTV